MKVEDRRLIALSRSELKAAVLRYCGLSEDAIVDTFHVTSDALADPQPVVHLVVIVDQREEESYGR